MSMSKKDFIALADEIKYQNEQAARRGLPMVYAEQQVNSLADFCYSQNPAFMRDRWKAYIAGECGPSGGAIKKKATTTLGPCSCKKGIERDNCAACEGTGQRIDFATIRASR